MKTSKPLIEVRKPLRVRVYRGKFKPFASTKYLDAGALRRLRKGRIEVGTVEAAGSRQTVAAEIRNGKVVALKPVACENCTPKRSKKTGRAVLKESLRQVGVELREQGLDRPMRPVAIRISRRFGFEIPIGPIVIIIGDPAPGGIFDVCYTETNGNQYCWWCLLGESGCMTLG